MQRDLVILLDFFQKPLHSPLIYYILQKLVISDCPVCMSVNVGEMKKVSTVKAMKQKVAELSGNFCGELSVPETGEGILMIFLCVKKYETHGTVYRAIAGLRVKHS